MEFLILLVFILAGTFTVSSEIYSSMAHIEDSLERARNARVQEWINERFVRPEEARLETLKEVVRTTDSLDSLIHKYEKMKDSLITYRLVKNVQKMTNLKNKVRKISDDVKPLEIKDLMKHFDFLPKEEDLKGSITGLARLQTVYDLPTQDLMAGLLNGKPSRPLTVEEAMDIVTHTENLSAEGLQNYNYTLTWLIEINKRRVSMATDKKVYIKLLRMMAMVYLRSRCSCCKEMQQIKAILSKVDPSFSSHIEQVVKGCKSYNSRKDCRLLTERSRVSDETRRFFAVCRGEQIKIPEYGIRYKTPVHKLKCILRHHDDPRLILKPVKIEILNKKGPFIAMLHDTVTDREIEFIRSVAKPTLVRGTYLVGETNVRSDIKVSKTMFLPNGHVKTNGHLKKFRDRLETMTQLNSMGFSNVKVANYGVGGVYGVHIDYKIPDKTSTLADIKDVSLVTVVNYMTDVEHGGMTVFPELGIKSIARKGNALFFYNLFRNGTGNILTQHASCPVLYGNKWVAIQWVKRNEQEFTNPCSLNKLE